MIILISQTSMSVHYMTYQEQQYEDWLGEDDEVVDVVVVLVEVVVVGGGWVVTA